jgi:asparagine synthase (glutamine-hydrolysing)
MCGITGVVVLNKKGEQALSKINASVNALIKRGPDGKGVFIHENTALGHRRLAIIDKSDAASQPFTDPSGRYTIIFNGEFFNYRECREELTQKGMRLISHSDTEVLLRLFIERGPACLEKINGFFSFAVYDNQTRELFLTRDRYGIKPLLIYQDENIFAFASEMKALFAYDIPRELDKTSLFTYLQLNYIPSPASILKSVSKMEPGHYLTIRNGEVQVNCYYKIPYQEMIIPIPDYEKAKKKIFNLLETSVGNRLISDVPLGCFLSGGIDSSIITALAAKNTEHLKTFSIGYKDEPLYDETRYAKLLAKQFNTDHTVFSIGNEDLFENLYQVLDYMDEPFADSSALAVYILSKKTRKHVTVSLSGDGADELFGGYNKHTAEIKIRNQSALTALTTFTKPLWSRLPKSRNSAFGNKIRQLKKYNKGASLTPQERYWLWAGYADETTASQLLQTKYTESTYRNRKSSILKNLNADFNSVLLTDMNLILQSDMLAKVDSMSMANGLEVRVPFLDFNLVNYAFALPAKYKTSEKGSKLILKDTFRSLLPKEIMERRKHGFEVPLLKWFKTDLKTLITENLLSKKFIDEQGIFNYNAVHHLLEELFSVNPDDAVARVWGLIVFQYWWKKYMSNTGQNTEIV